MVLHLTFANKPNVVCAHTNGDVPGIDRIVNGFVSMPEHDCSLRQQMMIDHKWQ